MNNKSYVAEISERPLIEKNPLRFKKVDNHKELLKAEKEKGLQPLGIHIKKTF